MFLQVVKQTFKSHFVNKLFLYNLSKLNSLVMYKQVTLNEFFKGIPDTFQWRQFVFLDLIYGMFNATY